MLFVQCAFFKISTKGVNVLCSWEILNANDLIKYSVDCKCSLVVLSLLLYFSQCLILG